jgi:hypothetical protein
LGSWWQSLFPNGPVVAPSPRRLDGGNKTLLATSIKMLPYDEPGWITSKEAKSLFSPMDDEHAFGEMDEVGKENLASFASEMGDGCLFEFMPVDGRGYFIRKAAQRSPIRGSSSLATTRVRRVRLAICARKAR